MGGNEEFKAGEFAGKVLQKLEALDASQKDTLAAINGIGNRVNLNEKAIERVQGEMNIVLTIGRWILAPVFSLLGLSAVFSIGWYLYRK